jgi:UDP-3-O-[3-hydroxymyristoyl] glucosamine N-acyltransferase
MKVSGTVFAPGETVGAAELTRAGLLLMGEQVTIDATAVFAPVDAEGTVRRIEIGSGARVGAYALICGGACIGENAHVEEHTIVGKPEKGYAVGQVYPGTGARTQIGPGVVVRAGAVIYAGVQAGAETVIGHHTLLRSFVTVGEDTQLGHSLTVEAPAHVRDRHSSRREEATL